jgi:hypothetical protein
MIRCAGDLRYRSACVLSRPLPQLSVSCRARAVQSRTSVTADLVAFSSTRNLPAAKVGRRRSGSLPARLSSAAVRAGGTGRAGPTRHWRVLREAGLVYQRDAGNGLYIRLRKEDLDRRFPGLIQAVIAAN